MTAIATSTPAVQTVKQLIKTILREIVAAQKRLDRNHGDELIDLLVIAQKLNELRQLPLTNRQWIKIAAGLGYQRRTASRMLTLGNSWLTVEFLRNFEFLHKIPVDLLKLVLLVKLDQEDLTAYLKVANPRKVSRQQVKKSVCEILGLPTLSMKKLYSTLTAEKLEAAWKSGFERIREAFENLDAEFEDSRETLLTAFQSDFATIYLAIADRIAGLTNDDEFENEGDFADLDADEDADVLEELETANDQVHDEH